MAAKGSVAKIEVRNKIMEAFGESFIGEVDKKLYVLANDGGETVQIAIAMTCPKNPIEVGSVPAVSTPGGTISPAKPAKAEISQEETDKVVALMKSLNIDI